MHINEINALGLNLTQGMYLTDGWYWDQDDDTRVWAKRYFEKMKKMPSAMQAADYSAVTTYLKAVKAIGTDDGDKVMAQMKTAKISDMYTKNGVIRPDGRMVHDMYLRQVKNSGGVQIPVGLLQDRANASPAKRPSRPRPKPSAPFGNKGRLPGRGGTLRARHLLPFWTTACVVPFDWFMEIFGIPHQAMMAQLLLGLVNGSFYAMLSLGLAIIFGLLNVINLSHGALYMMGAFAAWMGMNYLGLNYWVMLVLAPLVGRHLWRSLSSGPCCAACTSSIIFMACC